MASQPPAPSPIDFIDSCVREGQTLRGALSLRDCIEFRQSIATLRRSDVGYKEASEALKFVVRCLDALQQRAAFTFDGSCLIVEALDKVAKDTDELKSPHDKLRQKLDSMK